jgi:hypothetical protein
MIDFYETLKVLSDKESRILMRLPWVRLLIRQLSRRFGKINDRRIQIINSLTLEQLDDLGEALLDFGELADLDNWLGFRIGE